jgi:SAM-dependent methyltransferase
VILHKLIFRFIRHRDDTGFYRIQARDTVRWLEKVGIRLGSDVTALDLGSGHGIIGGELMKKGCRVTFADESNGLLDEYRDAEFRSFDIEKGKLCSLGQYDLVICSNVLEHISRPDIFLGSVDCLLKPGGKLYLSWTNWLSPWGGHDYSPFHYLGVYRGLRLYDRFIGKPRVHTPYVTLFPTSIAGTLRDVRGNRRLRVAGVLPRYYPRLSFITRVPVVREFLTFNCLIIAERV